MILGLTRPGRAITGEMSTEYIDTLSGGLSMECCTSTERILLGLWSELLMRSLDSIDADFFELGGHSVLAARLVSDLRRTHLITGITVRDVYLHRTLRDIAVRIDDLKYAGTENRRDRAFHSEALPANPANSVSVWAENVNTEAVTVDMPPPEHPPNNWLHALMPYIVSGVLLYILVCR